MLCLVMFRVRVTLSGELDLGKKGRCTCPQSGFGHLHLLASPIGVDPRPSVDGDTGKGEGPSVAHGLGVRSLGACERLSRLLVRYGREYMAGRVLWRLRG